MSSFLTGLMEGVTPSVRKKAGGAEERRKMSNSKYKGGTYGGEAAGGTDPDPELHKGGKVRKTRSYKLKRGERVLSPKQAKRYERKRGSKR